MIPLRSFSSCLTSLYVSVSLSGSVAPSQFKLQLAEFFPTLFWFDVELAHFTIPVGESGTFEILTLNLRSAVNEPSVTLNVSSTGFSTAVKALGTGVTVPLQLGHVPLQETALFAAIFDVLLDVYDRLAYSHVKVPSSSFAVKLTSKF